MHLHAAQVCYAHPAGVVCTPFATPAKFAFCVPPSPYTLRNRKLTSSQWEGGGDSTAKKSISAARDDFDFTGDEEQATLMIRRKENHAKKPRISSKTRAETPEGGEAGHGDSGGEILLPSILLKQPVPQSVAADVKVRQH